MSTIATIERTGVKSLCPHTDLYAQQPIASVCGDTSAPRLDPMTIAFPLGAMIVVVCMTALVFHFVVQRWDRDNGAL